MKRLSTLLATMAFAVACSGEVETKAGNVAEHYQRAVECAGTHMAISKLDTAIAQTDAQSFPTNAEQAREGAARNDRAADRIRRIAEQLGADPTVGRTSEQVARDIAAADRAWGQRVPVSVDFVELVEEMDAEMRNCVTEFGAPAEE